MSLNLSNLGGFYRSFIGFSVVFRYDLLVVNDSQNNQVSHSKPLLIESIRLSKGLQPTWLDNHLAVKILSSN